LTAAIRLQRRRETGLARALHGVTAPRLRETCAWLARNLPFVDHVALMGLENTGFALANQALLWIDPLDYQADLAGGVDMLRAAGERLDLQPTPLSARPLGVGRRSAVDLRLEERIPARMRRRRGAAAVRRILFLRTPAVQPWDKGNRGVGFGYDLRPRPHRGTPVSITLTDCTCSGGRGKACVDAHDTSLQSPAR